MGTDSPLSSGGGRDCSSVSSSGHRGTPAANDARVVGGRHPIRRLALSLYKPATTVLTSTLTTASAPIPIRRSLEVTGSPRSRDTEGVPFMSNQADVRSIEALEDLRVALGLFADDALAALGGVEMEVRRTIQWLQHD